MIQNLISHHSAGWEGVCGAGIASSIPTSPNQRRGLCIMGGYQRRWKQKCCWVPEPSLVVSSIVHRVQPRCSEKGAQLCERGAYVGQCLHYCIVSNRWQQSCGPPKCRNDCTEMWVFMGTARSRNLHFLEWPGSSLCRLVIVCPAGKGNAHPPVFTHSIARHNMVLPEF